jgi:hypothetical protein
MRSAVHFSWVAASFVTALLIGISAGAEEELERQDRLTRKPEGEASFAVGLTYINGIGDVNDFITDSLGDDVDSLNIPVGVAAAGGYRFACGGEIMGHAGPFSLTYLDVDNGSFAGDYFDWDMPVGLTAGYVLFSGESISPYLRGGIRYHIAGGDFHDHSSPGLYVAGGVNFFANKVAKLQFEIAYDDATVEYEDFAGSKKKIKPGGWLVSIRAAF